MSALYIASFFTQLGAVEFYETLKSLGDDHCRMMPVPRQISVSCGTGVRFSLPFDPATMANPDLEAIYRVEGETYKRLWQAE